MVRKYSGPLLPGKRSAKVTKDKSLLIKKRRKMDRRRIAKNTEDERVKWICIQINERTEIGNDMRQSYHTSFGKQIYKVYQTGSLRDHYDILIHHTDGTTRRCEEKGTDTYRDISDSPCPWQNSVQFYNGPSKGFAISRKYLKSWYDIIICDETFINKYNLSSIPNFDEWLSGGPDCMMTKPSGEWSKELKTKYRELNNGGSMGGKGQGNNDIDYRIRINEMFTMNDEDKAKLIEVVQRIYDDVMHEKECWLQTSGNPMLDGRLSFKWHDRIMPKDIVSVDMIKNKDIEFIFHLTDGNTIGGIMRWGGGCGFSCFRMDLK